MRVLAMCYYFFFNDTATTEIYTLSLHDALPIFLDEVRLDVGAVVGDRREGGGHLDRGGVDAVPDRHRPVRSEEHTSELQSRQYLVCRLLLEKKKTSILHIGFHNVVSGSLRLDNT